jgi:hypothetical protein
MTTCDCCNQEMLTTAGCKDEYLTYDGHRYLRLKFGDVKQVDTTQGVVPWDRQYGRCHDCGAAQNGIHHPGCDWERCPICPGFAQLISCEHGDLLNAL